MLCDFLGWITEVITLPTSFPEHSVLELSHRVVRKPRLHEVAMPKVNQQA